MDRNTATPFLAGALIGMTCVAFSSTDFAAAAASAFTSSTIVLWIYFATYLVGFAQITSRNQMSLP